MDVVPCGKDPARTATYLKRKDLVCPDFIRVL